MVKYQTLVTDSVVGLAGLQSDLHMLVNKEGTSRVTI